MYHYGRYRHKKTRKPLIYMVMRVFVGPHWTIFWWRRRESNPRPPVLCHWLYMFILNFNLTGCYPSD